MYCNYLPKPEEDEDLLRNDVWRQDAEVVVGVLIAGRSVVVEHAPRQAGKHLDNRLIRQFVILSLFIHYAFYCTHVVEDIWLLCRRGTGPLESQPKELSVQEGVRVKDDQTERDQVQKLK